jgi:hypothetical protein
MPRLHGGKPTTEHFEIELQEVQLIHVAEAIKAMLPSSSDKSRTTAMEHVPHGTLCQKPACP